MCFRELFHVQSFVVERRNMKVTLGWKYSACNDKNNKHEMGPEYLILTTTTTTTTVLPPFYPGSSRWAGARRELLDFMVHGKINSSRHTTIRLAATPSGLTSAHVHHPTSDSNIGDWLSQNYLQYFLFCILSDLRRRLPAPMPHQFDSMATSGTTDNYKNHWSSCNIPKGHKLKHQTVAWFRLVLTSVRLGRGLEVHLVSSILWTTQGGENTHLLCAAWGVHQKCNT